MALDIKKPKEFENRVLRSEKSDQKKFKGTSRFIQNTVTHYNFYFNANNKLNDIIERARLAFKDDYSKLLPFYNYSLDVTAADSIQLDSVSYKAQSGIVLHDLRSDWADNMYLLWGITYYLRKDYDSAYKMFQFINYAFAARNEYGDYRVIGSARDDNNAFNISTKEKGGLMNKLFKEPPSRNDAFVWQVRNYLAQDRFAEASSLIQALKRDTLFPSRLDNDLEEMEAYYFYRQQRWDSAAAHLEKALSTASTKQEKARWEYLLGQLYEASGQYKESEKWYDVAIGHTTDPIMDIYARLASIRVNKDGGDNYIEKNSETLLKMAKRDKYVDYRDIIYYMAAQMELERNNIDGALALLLKSTKYDAIDAALRNKTFLQLAELSFTKKLYRESFNYYDSLKMDDPALVNTADIIARKSLLSRLADNIEIISRQDSLQNLASLSEDDRKSKVKSIVRRLRKAQGLKDEGSFSTGSAAPLPTIQTAPNLFTPGNTKGEWYFYNANSRQKGATDFKTKWGTRPNVDNWRRSAALSATIAQRNDLANAQQQANGSNTSSPEDNEVTYDALYNKIPLTPEKLKSSNDSLQNALYTLGILYIQELEDCQSGTETLEQLRERFRTHSRMEDVLFNLYYCYNKNSNVAKSTEMKQLLITQFPNSNSATIVKTGKNPKSDGPHSEATRTYERIYDLFIEGKFSEATEQKRIADNQYGRNYWTPQLLYIESVYYIKQNNDSLAKNSLNNIVAQFSGTPIAEKAITMLDVLSRRKQIEDELRNLVIEMPAEDTTQAIVDMTPITPTRRPQQQQVVIQRPTTAKDSLGLRPVNNQGAPTMNPVSIKPTAIDSTPVATVPPPVKADTIAVVPKPKPSVAGFNFEAATPHYVVIILNKVDPIFVNEAKNAYARYNRNNFYNKQMQAELVEIDADNRLLLISPFKNAAEAVEYIDQVKPKTTTEIVPWLKGGKFTYSIINEKNLEVLKNNKEIDKYQQFLQQNVPGKF